MTVETILLVDDSKTWIELAEEFVQVLYDLRKVDVVNSLQDVKNIVSQKNQYDLYVVDSLGGPGGAWKPVTEYIKKVHEDARIIINTARPDDMRRPVEEAGLKVIDKMKFSDYLDSVCKRKD